MQPKIQTTAETDGVAVTATSKHVVELPNSEAARLACRREEPVRRTGFSREGPPYIADDIMLCVD